MLKVNRLRQRYLNQTSSQMVAQAASAIAITFGCLVMLSSLFNLDFKSYPLTMGTITANTALCFILSGVLLWLSTGGREDRSQESGVRRQESGDRSQETGVRSQEGGVPGSSDRIAKICAFTVYTISLLTLSQYVFSWIGIDELVLRLPSSLMTFHPGRMGLNTVLNFILIARALELLNEPLTSRSSYWYAQILALVAGVISGLAVMGYAYKVEILYRILQQSTPMALLTAVTFIVVCVGILWVRTDQGFMRVVMNDTYGGLLARRLLVATIVVPFVLGWLILQGQRSGLYKPAFALSLLVAVLIISLCVLIWLNAALVEGLSSDRQQADQALRQSEERFRLAVDNIPDIFAIYDEKQRFQFANAEGLRRFHKSLKDIFGRTDEEIFPPYITQAYLATLHKAKETRTAQTTEATFSSVYGKFTALVKFVPILDDLGEIYQILGFAEDITERKRAEETLINQQKWLEDLLNLMPTPLVLIEPGTARVTFANRAADEVAGGKFPLAESIADYHTIYHSTDADGNTIPDELAPGVRVARGDRIDSFELDWHTPVGIRSLLIFADTLPAMHGHPATCVLVFQDITNLKQVEKALSLGYKRLHLLFNAANDLLSSQQPVALIDSLFRKLSEQIGLDVYFHYLVVEQTMQLASYSGIASEEAKKVEWLEFSQAVCGTAAEERRPIALENLQESTDPKTDFIRSVGIKAYYAYPLIAQGRFLGTLSFGSRSRVKFSQNEIGMMQAVCDQIAIALERARLIASLQQQTEQLKEANRMKDEFLAILSHELRSPLNAILGWSQLLRSRKLDEKKTAQAIETIERNAKAQTQLIGDLLDISRMIRGKLRLNVRPCNLVPVIEAAMETVRLAAEVKKIDVKFSHATPEPELDLGLENTTEQSHNLKSKIQNPKFQVSGDAERLQQVIWNLLSNAIKFTPTGGSVEVQLSKELGTENNSQFPIPNSPFPIPHSQFPTPYAQITVSDTGIGIGTEFLPYVFDRFRQADSSSTRPHGGLGLGLAIVRHLVELHGGTVDVESPGVGKGATFTVKLPLLKESRSAPQARRGEDNIAPIEPSPTTPIGLDLSGIKVLVVDDEADTRDYLTTVLQQCQAHVKAVASAKEALDTLEEWKPDVLVSDIAMPEEDGYSLIRKVRSRENAATKESKIPAAALTAYARAEDRTLALQAGFQMHLPKPVEPNELATVVASLAGRN